MPRRCLLLLFQCSLLLLLPCGLVLFSTAARAQEAIKVRGVLPWHNFLSGPSAWNLPDYEKYLDECARQDINFIAFHNYTGGGERYASYVEPMIRISYRNIVPDAKFDNSLTSRWGYYPMKVKDFAFGTAAAFSLPEGAEAFGADCSVLSGSPEKHYAAARDLMRKVIQMAHARKMEVAMGFEFGVLPPEYFSLNTGSGAFYWRGEANMVPNPAHPLAIELLQTTIDALLEAYPNIDWITLWLNEHSFMGVDVDGALRDASFNAIYRQNAPLFGGTPGLEGSSESQEVREEKTATFIGVWSLQYIRLAYDYIKKKAPGVKLMLSGWGGGNQLPMILRGLDRGLPADIVFSCLNPGLGTEAQPDFLAEIARNRQIWAMPWLEGDHQLWHYQPRVGLMREQVKEAARQGLDGVVAIHWRTEETKLNMETFAHFAGNPASTRSVSEQYRDFLKRNCGPRAAQELTALFVEADTSRWRASLASPEYFAYTPVWGRMNDEALTKTRQLIAVIDRVLSGSTNAKHKENLLWFKKTFEFEFLLHEVGRCIEPAYDLRNDLLVRTRLHAAGENALSGNVPGESASARSTPADSTTFSKALTEAKQAFEKAPVKELFQVFASKVRSRGELGELSALNQKLWVEYLSLKNFLEDHE